MRVTTRFVYSLSILVLMLFLTACTSKPQEPAAPAFADQTAIDLLWKYEMAVVYKMTDPAEVVTGTEQLWLDQFLADKAAGKLPKLTWTVNDAVVRATKTGARESLAQSVFSVQDREHVVQFKFVPVNGAWKIENHQTLEGTWWAPEKE